MRDAGFFVFALFFTLVACRSTGAAGSRATSAQDRIGSMQWLSGCWKGVHQGEAFYECWEKKGDSALVNYEVIIGSDTSFERALAIRPIGQDIFLSDGKTAGWKLDSLSADYIRLRNDSAKGSKIIRWQFTKEGHWLTIGANGKVIYDMTRVEELEHRFRNRPKSH